MRVRGVSVSAIRRSAATAILLGVAVASGEAGASDPTANPQGGTPRPSIQELHDQGVSFLEAGQGAKARGAFQAALARAVAERGAGDLVTLIVAERLAFASRDVGDVTSALALSRGVVAARRQFHANDTLGLADALNTLCLMALAAGEVEFAATSCTESLEQLAGAPTKPLDLQGAALNNLGLALHRAGELDRGEAALREALDVARKTGPPSLVALRSANLASVIGIGERALEARNLLHEGLDLLASSAEGDEPLLAQLLHNLARVEHGLGSPAEAERQYRRAIEIRTRRLGAAHPDLGASLSGLGAVLAETGDWDEASRLIERAVAIDRAAGVGGPSLARALSNQASIDFWRGDTGRAGRALSDAIGELETAGADPGDLAALRAMLAWVKRAEGDLPEADALSAEALAAAPAKGLVGAFVRFHRGRTLHALGRPGEAVRLLRGALAERQQHLPPAHPDVAAAHLGLGVAEWASGRFADASGSLRAAIAAEDESLRIALAGLPERRRLGFVASLASSTNVAIAFHQQSGRVDPAAAVRFGFEVVVHRRGRSMDAAVGPRFGVVAPELAVESRRVAHALGARWFSPAPASSRSAVDLARMDELFEQYETLEREAGAFGLASPRTPRTAAETLARKLPGDSALLVYVAYNRFDPADARFGEARYGVYALKRDGAPRFFDLGAASELESEVESFRRALASPAMGAREPAMLGAAAALSKRILEPLADVLGEYERLLVMADGVLHLVPFEALVDEDRRFVIESDEIVYVSSVGDLLRGSVASPRDRPLLLASRFGLGRSPIITDDEVARIAKIIALPEDRIRVGGEVVREALGAARGPRILHLASHAFFGRPDELAVGARVMSGLDIARSGHWRSTNPLLRSGVILRASPTTEPDYMTALDFASLDLSGTDLAVLSGCTTGLGDVVRAEGVYGLRRALAIAGAASQVTSLWLVHDRATTDLMEHFYRELQKGVPRAAALRAAKRGLARSPAYAHPYYWAGFVLTGAWGPVDGPAFGAAGAASAAR